MFPKVNKPLTFQQSLLISVQAIKTLFIYEFEDCLIM